MLVFLPASRLGGNSAVGKADHRPTLVSVCSVEACREHYARRPHVIVRSGRSTVPSQVWDLSFRVSV